MPRKKSIAYDPLESIHTALPERIPVMPVKSTVIFPTSATGLQVGFRPNVEVLSLHPGKSLVVAMVNAESDDDGSVDPASLEKVGTAARVLNRLNLPGGTIQATIQGLIRVHLEEIRFENGYYTAYPRLVEEDPVPRPVADELIERILSTLGAISARVPRLEDVAGIVRKNLDDPGRVADLIANLAHFDSLSKDAVLQRLDVEERLRYVSARLEAEWQRIQQLDSEAREPSDAEEVAEHGDERPRATKRQRRSQEIRSRIRSLQAELGEVDPAEKAAIELLRRIERGKLPTRVASVARPEAEKLRHLSPVGPEADEIRVYIETLLELPWERTTENDGFDLEAVERALNEKHIGLEDAKLRLLEFLSVAGLRGNVRGLVPCLVGPPEVGKRSLAAAVARGLGRPLVRLELAGRGEAELIGSRRVRTGAEPGRLVTAFREAGVRDPVYLLEEIDLVGLGKVEGDPVEALEEFMDPRSRHEHVDRYVGLPFDMTEAVFIATANDFNRIPRSIRDFLIEIRIAGYTPEEKTVIAREQMLPRLIAEHGLTEKEVNASEETLEALIRGYARDSGLGHLRRSLSAVLRYIAHEKVTGAGKKRKWKIDTELIEKVLGSPRYFMTEAESRPEIGVVTGLAWTATGGELMFIEALRMPGRGKLMITGLLGDVMRESVNAAYSYVRSRGDKLGISHSTFDDNDVHIHFPVGATPKDGPSAGAAVTLAIASSLADRPVRHDLAMTGEVTLRGKVMDIGGVKEKVLAAYRAGLREVILPLGNQRDLREVPDDVREGMKFHFVSHMDEIFDLALLGEPTAPRRRGRRASIGVERTAKAAAEKR